jgi:hypothetical protein
MSTVTRLTVHITDANDHTPRFTATGPIPSLYVAELLENNFVGAYVTQVSATDSDINDNALLRYVIADVLPETDIDAVSRDSTKTSWDSEVDGNVESIERMTWNTELLKKDKAQGRDNRRQGQIKDRKSRPRVDVRKEASRQQEGRKYEVDGRRQIRSEPNQKISNKDCWANFNVDSMTGIITAKKSFDYETAAVYNCRLLAIDNGTPARTGRCHTLDCSTGQLYKC